MLDRSKQPRRRVELRIIIHDYSHAINSVPVRNHWAVAKPIGADKKRTNSNLPEALGAELTRQRSQRQWSQQQLAEKLGYDVSYIGQIERGEKSPTLRTLMDLARVFDLKLSALIRAAESKIEIPAKSTHI